jgi:hypothetical protein
MKSHVCLNGVKSFEDSVWTRDRFGIPLFRGCARCRDSKLALVSSSRLPGAREDIPVHEAEGEEYNYGVSRR